jgi:hypothetical protein
LEEIKGSIENLATKEELKQLENLTQRIQDWVFLDGQLENVVGTSFPIFISFACNSSTFRP